MFDACAHLGLLAIPAPLSFVGDPLDLAHPLVREVLCRSDASAPIRGCFLRLAKGETSGNEVPIERAILNVKLRWDSMQTLNAWLAQECRAAWSELNHPEWPALKVADVPQDEQLRLMPNTKSFDGYVEVLARVSSTALVHLQRNRYSVSSEHAHAVVSLRLYPERLDISADNTRVASHVRSFERSQTFYDWRATT